MLKLDLTQAQAFIKTPVPAQEVEAARKSLLDGTCAGNDFIGWVRLPKDYDKEEFARIQSAAGRIQQSSQALVVIGIGGSYLGARAVLELLKSPNYNLLPKNTPDIYFIGNGLSGDAIQETIQLLEGKDWSINVISKSGTTLEPALAFRLFRGLLEEKYGKDGAKSRIFATTDKAKGVLKTMADSEGWETFVVPDDVGGRYSVLTAVGLLPLAVAGIDIQALMNGAKAQMDECLTDPNSSAAEYAAARSALYRAGLKVEVLAFHEPSFRFFCEWYKQLYAESEGKGGKGLFPAGLELTADLHSIGQYLQDGQRILLETVVSFAESRKPLIVQPDPADLDGLNYVAGKTMDHVALQARRGTALAHVDGGVPNLSVTVPRRDEDSVGRLIYFFEFACAVSGLMLGVNPFDQPGVEAYKKNMFALLGKPGTEEKRAELERRMN
jgi:glucose-6-phosphate isomerase